MSHLFEFRNCPLNRTERDLFVEEQTTLLELLKVLGIDYDELDVVDRIKVDIYLEKIVEKILRTPIKAR